MKIDKLETHDRLLEFQKQADYISQGCQDCIKNRPQEFGSHPFYIFCHKREIGIDERINMFNTDIQKSITDPLYSRKFVKMDDIPTHRLIWEPRLTKPVPQSNSMLFRYYPKTDVIKVLWMIPQEELWGQYKQGNMTENSVVSESIHNYIHDKNKLSHREEDDLTDEQIDIIYTEMSINAQRKRKVIKLTF